jgi:aryl-alcohol dehydrogenase-like predicted oxidoreductase
MQNAMAQHAGQLDQFQRLCTELEESPGVVALAWLLHQPGVVATIIGPGSAAQIKSVLRVPDVRLDVKTLEQIDKIFPPCGEAPEAYAW